MTKHIMQLSNFSYDEASSPRTGLEPVSFRLTAERASQLRHRECLYYASCIVW